MKKFIFSLAITVAVLTGCSDKNISQNSNNGAVDFPKAQADILTSDSRDADCDIKGNISQSTGEKIYHMPGQQYYGKTQIDESDGERWFCSESEARTAGWRKSKR